MGGMGDVRQTVYLKQLEVLQELGKALEREGLELEQLQKNLLQARQLVDGVLETDGAEPPETQSEIIVPITNESLEERIRRRAAEIFLERGGGEGRDLENWLQAETEILAAAGLREPGSTPAETPAAVESEANVETGVTQSIEERIRCRAAEIYGEHGGGEGRDVEYWLQAEAEILARMLPRSNERRNSGVRSGTDRRVACLPSPTGEERRCGADRRQADRRVHVITTAGQA